jgi:hypothetical protein
VVIVHLSSDAAEAIASPYQPRPKPYESSCITIIPWNAMTSTDQETDDRPRERLVSESFKGPTPEERGEHVELLLSRCCVLSYAILHMTSPTTVEDPESRKHQQCGGSPTRHLTAAGSHGPCSCRLKISTIPSALFTRTHKVLLIRCESVDHVKHEHLAEIKKLNSQQT